MLARTVRSRPLLALVGAAAGVASVAVAPAGASAQPAAATNADTPATALPAETVTPVDQPSAGPVPASHGTCLGATTFTGNQTGLRYFLPTTSDGSGQTHCALVRGNNGLGVNKLQSALNLCNNRESLELDGDFGGLTEAAVVRAQQLHGINPDGRYGPVTRSALRWPGFNANNVHTACTQLVFNP